MESYGAFIELAPNLAGLAELRDFSREELLAGVGEGVSVYIKSILPDRMKVKLALIDVGEPAPTAPGIPRLPADASHPPRLTRWQYSPAGSRKLVETVFGEA